MHPVARLFVCASVVGTIAAMVGQGAPPGQTQAPRPPTFRVDANLATLDAVVVGEDGRHLTDLTVDDFEVLERGKPAPVRQAIYVGARRRVPGPSPAGASVDDGALPAGGGDTGQLLAIVVDDLGLSFESAERVRTVLHGFVNTGIDAGLRIAVVRTSGSGGVPQSFTSDRQVVAAAVERVRYSARSRTAHSSFEPVLSMDPGPSPLAPRPTLNLRDLDADADEIRQEASASGSVGALQALLRGLAPWPGRKSVLFVSEGFDIGLTGADGREGRTRERRGGTFGAFARVVDTANRSGVVLYTLNPAGLLQTTPSAQDLFRADDLTPAQHTQIVSNETQRRQAQLTSTQASLRSLAEETGGFAVIDSNALAAGLSQISEDMRGYYLIGFDTSLDVKAPWSPNDVQLRVKRARVAVRARRGLFGPANGPPTPGHEGDALVTAALSPFDVGAIDVKVTSLFGYDAKTGPFVHATLVVDPADVSFIETGDGRRKASVTLLVMAIGEDGVPVARIRRQVTMKLTPDDYRGVQQGGLRCAARVPIEKPGGYQVRVAIQDDLPKTIGTRTQFVDVPRAGKGYVTISGLAVADGHKTFKTGDEVMYAAELYDGRDKRGGLVARTTLQRDGHPVFSGAPRPIGGGAASRSVQTTPVNGSITLGMDVKPGPYTLHISVIDEGGREAASQWAELNVQ
jgi:VWFA-related protein